MHLLLLARTQTWPAAPAAAYVLHSPSFGPRLRFVFDVGVDNLLQCRSQRALDAVAGAKPPG